MKTYFHFNLKELLSLLFLVLHTLAMAHNKNTAIEEINPFAERKTSVLFPKAFLPNSENIHSDILKLFRREVKNLKTGQNTIQLIKFSKSPLARHYLYQQRFNNIAVYNATLKINIEDKGRVFSLYDNSYNTENWNYKAIQNEIYLLKNSEAVTKFESKFPDANIQLKEINIAVIDNNPIVVFRYRIHNETTHDFREYLVNINGEILLSLNLNCNHRSNAIASALVHLPDPVTRAQSIYAPPYVDANNTTNASLDAQRILVQLEVTDINGVYVLENDYVAIKDFDAPFFPPPQSNFPEFIFNRSQPEFEQANAFYHITEYQKYVQSLAFSNLPGYQIQLDAHALNGDDNSLFSTATFPPRLFFGTGGIADAEDADVVVHEYGHALSDAANGNNFGNERRALDEGIGDYFATSYSKSIDTFRWADMFTWDGHNEFWDGRNAATTKKYPEDLTNNIHANGEIWSSAIMDVWDNLGRETTDKLMLQTLYSLSGNMTFKDAANEFLRSDTLLFNGTNFCEIYYPLLKKGLVDSLTTNVCELYDANLFVNAGNDTVICFGDSITLNAMNTNDGSSYLWTNNNNTTLSNSTSVTIAPEETATYFLRRTTTEGNFNIDSVKVSISFCEISVTNTAGFKDGNSPLKIVIPPNVVASIKLSDVSGKILLEKNDINRIFTIDSHDFSSGMYILSIYTNKKPKSYRLIKVSQF